MVRLVCFDEFQCVDPILDVLFCKEAFLLPLEDETFAEARCVGVVLTVVVIRSGENVADL